MITVPEIGHHISAEFDLPIPLHITQFEETDRYELIIYMTRKMPYEQYEAWMLDYARYLEVTGIHPHIQDVTNEHYDIGSVD